MLSPSPPIWTTFTASENVRVNKNHTSQGKTFLQTIIPLHTRQERRIK